MPDSSLNPSSPALPVTLRGFRASDLPACRQLYVEGLIGGKLAENDTAFDIDDIQSAYVKSPGGAFFVAQSEGGEVLGMVGVQQHEPGVGEIRRLRVRADSRRRGIGSALLEHALKFCQERGCLKITVDTFIERDPAIKLFERFHFKYALTRKVGDRDLLYFYLDLYKDERKGE